MTQQLSLGPPTGGATFSPDGLYRYHLWRELGNGHRRTCLFVMLNPSRADARDDDPTIRRCVGFANRLECGRLEAWGAHPGIASRVAAVRDLAAEVGVPLLCLGVTKGGHPRHPLYLSAHAPLVPWRPR